MQLIATDNTNVDFIALTRLLDADLTSRYGELQKEYAPHNTVEHIRDVLVAYLDGAPVACGAFKRYNNQTVEIKRIFVRPENRGNGISKRIVQQLEATAKAQGYTYAVLETGTKQHEAIRLYQRLGYTIIDNYPPYVNLPASICMKKAL